LKSPVGDLSDLFGKLAAGELPTQQSGQQERSHHQPKAELHLRPPSAIAKPVDRAIDRERQAKEDRVAREINEALNARHGEARTKGQHKDRDRD
jgi:hypothetical protein